MFWLIDLIADGDWGQVLFVCVVNSGESLLGEEMWLTDPPNPDMRVENNHCSASHTSSTGASTSDARL